MGIVSSLLLLPLAPVRGVLWLGGVLQERVEHELSDPAKIRRELETIDEAAAAGELSEEERKRAQQEVLNRLMRPSQAMPPSAEKE